MRESPGVDGALMRMAIDWAREAVGRTGENPAVGCCLAHGSRVLALARTATGGRPHAEERALALAGPLAVGATAYVTLEPCDRRTSGAPSCAELLVRAGVARVVVAARDPSQAGRGLRRLRSAGTRVEVGLLATSAEMLRARHRAQPGLRDHR
jgi:diaminohydroxyphosphoribosylaminopyrimidine deaminase/5-amino-6-(5-phosphoribosylamino)uracil reductase